MFARARDYHGPMDVTSLRAYCLEQAIELARIRSNNMLAVNTENIRGDAQALFEWLTAHEHPHVMITSDKR